MLCRFRSAELDVVGCREPLVGIHSYTRAFMRFSPPRVVILGAVTAFAAVGSDAAAAKAPKPLPAKSAAVRVARRSCVRPAPSTVDRSRCRNVTQVARARHDRRPHQGRAKADWDMAIVDRTAGRVLNGSAAARLDGVRVDVRRARASGSRIQALPAGRVSKAPRHATASRSCPSSKAPTTSSSSCASATSKADLPKRLEALGLDLADSDGGVYWDALLHSAATRPSSRRPASATTSGSATSPRATARTAARSSGARPARAGARSARVAALTSGRTSYRTLARDQTR